MNRRKFPRVALSLLVVCLAAAAVMLGSPSASGQRERRALEEISRVLESFDRLALDPAEVLRGARESGRVTLQTSRGAFELEVEPFDIRAEDYRAVAVGEGGVVRELPRTPSRSWRGKVAGAEGTYVRLVLDAEKFTGIIITPSETFFVEPARSLSAAAEANEYLFYAESSVKEAGGECGTTLAEQVGERAARAVPGRTGLKSGDPVVADAFAPKPEVEIANEADFEFFSDPTRGHNGNEANAVADMTQIITMADAIYDAQLNVKLKIVFQRVWTVASDPYTLTNAGNALDEFRNKYNQSFTSAGQPVPARDLAHMFTGKNFDGSTVGIAYISVACVADAFSYGISESKFTTNLQRRVGVTAHELGHNFGASHPNQEQPVPSSCGDANIMNSSIQDTQNFCQFSRDQITSHIADFGSCMTRLAQPGCSYTLSTPASPFFGPAGGTGTVGLNTTQANCEWGMAEGVEWIDAPGAFAGSGAAAFTVAPNTNAGPRQATIDAAGNRVTVRQAASPSCVGAQLTPGQTVTGALAPSDCRAGQPGRERAPLDLYNFTARAGQRVRIEMLAAVRASDTTSGDPPPEALDTFLYLFGPDGTVIFFNDDRATGSAHDTDSAIPISGFLTLPATGVYTIAATSYENGDDGNYTLRLTDNSSVSTVSLSSPSYTVDEGVGGGGLGADGVGFRVITVTRSANTPGTLLGTATVDYATSDGSASRQKDYTQALGTLVFGPGETSKSFTIFVPDDAFREPAETVQITLSNPVGTTLGANTTATLTINSADAADGPSPVRPESFNTAFFVRQQYLDFFTREPDESGFAFWQNDINVCGADAQCREVKRINVSAAFFLSIEFQETGYLVYRLYKSAYGDATSANVPGTVPVIRLQEFLPDTQRVGQGVVVGQAGWEQQLEANKQAFALEFVLRPRFLAAFPLSMTAEQFVDKLNQNAGGVLTQAQRDQLVAQVNSSADTAAARASVLRQVADNPALRQAELNRAFVLMQYYGYLRRNPDDAPEPGLNFGGWNFWLSKLNEFNGNFVEAEMVKAFLTSFEYIDRFGNR